MRKEYPMKIRSRVIAVASILLVAFGVILLGSSAALAIGIVAAQTPTPAGSFPQAPATNGGYTTPTPMPGTVLSMPDASGKAKERHCFSDGRTVQCFDTQAEALRVASNGRIQLPAGQTSATMDPAVLFAP